MARRAVGGLPRIDHDQRAAARLLIGQPPHEGRHGLGGVAADQQDGIGGREVRERERQPAVDAERPIPAAAADDMQNRPL